MMAWWDENGIPGPILLANKDNAAVLQHISDSSDPTSVEQRALDASSRGGVKATSIAGALFNNKDKKKGQQETHRQYFKTATGKTCTFPDTSNTHFQSHCNAAAELLIHLEDYNKFLEFVRDDKEKMKFSHMEQNLYLALKCPATLTELATLAAYAQIISHPYMRKI
jgi:hypothetical protein